MGEKVFVIFGKRKKTLEDPFARTKLAGVDVVVGNAGLIHAASSSRSASIRQEDIPREGVVFEGVCITTQEQAQKKRKRTTAKSPVLE